MPADVLKGLLRLSMTLSAVCLLLCTHCGSSTKLVYHKDQVHLRKVPPHTAVYIPLDHVRLTDSSRPPAGPDSLGVDSFFVDAANSLLRYELSQNFRMVHVPADSIDIKGMRKSLYSRLQPGGSKHGRAPNEVIHSLANTLETDLVILVYECAVRQRIVRPPGWRNDTYHGSYYDRPTSYLAYTSVHVQIWSSEGNILYEKIGKAKTEQPFLYSVFKQENPGDDIVRYARRIYAPPLIRALYKSIRTSLTSLQ